MGGLNLRVGRFFDVILEYVRSCQFPECGKGGSGIG